MHHGHSAPHNTHQKKIAYLDSPERNGGVLPDELLDKMPIEKGQTVVDFGAGTGYFSLPIAKRVENTVYALDIDSGMLDYLMVKARSEGIENIEPVHGSMDDLPLSETSVDAVFASLVLHEVTPLAPTLGAMHKLLKPGGYLICVEIDSRGADSHKAPRITPDDLESQLAAAGLTATETFFPAQGLYVLIAQK